MRIRFGPFKNFLIRWFIGHYAIDMDEALEPDPAAFQTFNAFFTRALKPDARPLEGDERRVISPADGRLTQWGSLHNGQLIQAKGLEYSVADLLGPVPMAGVDMTTGHYGTVYLAPYNYHRVHLPMAGTLQGMTLIPGQRYSVNDTTVKAIPNLFPGNERLICWFDTQWGTLAMVLVGALNVATMSTVWSGEVRRTGSAPSVFKVESESFARGAEIGRFNLGSTVVFVLSDPAVDWSPTLQAGQAVRMGQGLATLG